MARASSLRWAAGSVLVPRLPGIVICAAVVFAIVVHVVVSSVCFLAWLLCSCCAGGLSLHCSGVLLVVLLLCLAQIALFFSVHSCLRALLCAVRSVCIVLPCGTHPLGVLLLCLLHVSGSTLLWQWLFLSLPQPAALRFRVCIMHLVSRHCAVTVAYLACLLVLLRAPFCIVWLLSLCASLMSCPLIC